MADQGQPMRGYRSLEFLWAGGYTARYHGIRMLLPDTVGHHSYNVACTVMYLRPDCPARLLRAALKHDAAEHKVGDMPAPTKRAIPGLRDSFGLYEDKVMDEAGVPVEPLTPEELWVLKLCDSMDGMRYCIQERRMGNKYAVEIFEAFNEYVIDLLADERFKQPQDTALWMVLCKKWREVNYGSK
jgi:5'-deoxynucleotidase YfbR-like HD superfamily hydrolase